MDRIPIRPQIALTTIRTEDRISLTQHINDRSVYEHTLNVPHPYALADADRFIGDVQKFEVEHGIRKDWAIRIDGIMVGSIGFLFNYGVNAHKSEMGYWIGAAFRGRGIMTDVVRVFSDFGLTQLSLIRLEAHVFEGNEASKRVLEKAGFEFEGRLRAAFVKDSAIKNAYLFAKIKNSP